MLKELKDYLKITWDDEDSKLDRILQSGMEYLQDDIAGCELDFNSNQSNKDLLLDYCRYSYNNASEYFEENFKGKLLRLQLKSAVNASEKNEI